MPEHERRKLSDDEQARIARLLDAAPPLADASRRRIEQRRTLPPDDGSKAARAS
jgi:hypothetical protein